MLPNRYFICSREKPPVEFQVSQLKPVPDAEVAYFMRGFQILELDYLFDGYTICLAWSSTTKIPSVGPKVVVLIYGDEYCRVPTYAGEVAAVFKCCGFFPNFVTRRRPLRLAQIEAAEFLRNLALWLPGGWRWVLSSRTRSKCHLVPIGYGFATDVAPLPFAARPYLTSFLGSVAPPDGRSFLRRIVGTPKAFARSHLINVLTRLQPEYGEAAIPMRLTEGFQASIQDRGRSFFEVLARTKVCVAPRGTTHETWRICDGLRFGCIVIADRLPDHAFYRNSPIIQINDWEELPALLGNLNADEAKLLDLHERSLEFWRDTLSENALASRFAEVLGLSRRSHSAEHPTPEA